MRLLEHNIDTLNQVETFVSQKKNCCVVNACGSGKTSVMCQFIENHQDKTFLILTKQKNAAEYYKKASPVFTKQNVNIITYDKMHNQVKSNNTQDCQADFYMIDEAHYLGAKKWKKSYKTLIEIHHPISIGFTATPQRFEQQNTNGSIVHDFFQCNSAGNYTNTDLQKQGIFAKPKYVLSLYNMEELIEQQAQKINNSGMPAKDKFKFHTKLNDILKEWQNEYQPSIIFQKYLPNYLYKEKCNRILVYVESIQNIKQAITMVTDWVQKALPDKKIKTYEYTYKTPETVLSSFLKEDNNDIKILFSINKVTETLHIDDLKIAIMLRPAISHRVITQQFGRLNGIKNKKTPLIIDMVNNLEKLQKHTFYYQSEKTPQKQSKSTTPHIILPKFHRIYSVFSEIDAAVKQTETYRYNGFTGSIHDICFIYDCDVNETIHLLEENHNDIDLVLAKVKRKISGAWVKRDAFNDMFTIPDFDITDQNREMANRNIQILNQYIEKQQINDEDIRQNLYIAYYYWMSKKQPNIENSPFFKWALIQGIHDAHLRMLRKKARHEVIFNSNANANKIAQKNREEAEWEEISRRALHRQLASSIDKAKLTQKEKTVIIMRYGLNGTPPTTLEEIGNNMNVSRERIRQIEAKAMRKLRRPASSKPLVAFAEDIFENIK